MSTATTEISIINNRVEYVSILNSEIEFDAYPIANQIKRIFMNTPMQTELEKSKAHIIVEIIEYMPNAVVSKTIIKKTTGNVVVTSVDAGEELAEKITPFDTYIQIIDGVAEIYINDRKYKLRLGEGIIIPAHSKHHFNASVQFKMIATIIKSGYEE